MNPLYKLLLNNKAKGTFRAEVGELESTVYLYDAIVNDDLFGGVSAQAFVKELNAIKSPVINLRINSPGGDVFAGRAIETAIRDHKSEIHVYIDGLAASAASYVAIAGDKVIMSEGSFLMIHKAWTVAFGNADELIETADLLEKIDSSLITTYVNRTRQAHDQIETWLKDETWFTAQEALEYGFVDEIAEGKKASNQWDLTAYAKAPIVEEEPKQEMKKNTGHMLRIAALAKHF